MRDLIPARHILQAIGKSDAWDLLFLREQRSVLQSSRTTMLRLFYFGDRSQDDTGLGPNLLESNTFGFDLMSDWIQVSRLSRWHLKKIVGRHVHQRTRLGTIYDLSTKSEWVLDCQGSRGSVESGASEVPMVFTAWGLQDQSPINFIFPDLSSIFYCH
jgi:hypothetical protein